MNSFDNFGTFSDSEDSSNYSEFDQISSEEEHPDVPEDNKKVDSAPKSKIQIPRDPTISWSGKPTVKKTILTSDDFVPMAKDSTESKNQSCAQELMETTPPSNGKKKKATNKKKKVEENQKSEKVKTIRKSSNSKDKTANKRDEKEEGKTKKAALITTLDRVNRLHPNEGIKIVKKKKKVNSKSKDIKKKSKKISAQELREQLQSTYNELGSILFKTSYN